MKNNWLQLIKMVCLNGLTSLALAQSPTTTVISPANDDAQMISGEIAIGLSVLSDDSYRFGRFNGVVDQGLEPLFSLQLQSQPYWNSVDPRYASFSLEYLGAESINASAEIGRVGEQVLAIDYRKLSNFTYQETVTPFIGNSNLLLPTNWQTTGGTTQDFTNVSDLLQSKALYSQRDRWSFSFDDYFSNENNTGKEWLFNFDYRRESKQGRRALAATMGSTGGNARAAILALPIDFETNVVELGLQKNTANATYGLAYSISYFTNAKEQIRWANPFGQVAQWAPTVGFPDGYGQLALEPDNTAQQLQFNIGHHFNSTSIALDISRGKMTQDQSFLPYTINSNLLVTTPLPSDDLDGEIATTYINLRLNSRPLPQLHLVARYRFDDRDNKTPQYTFFPISGDAEDQGTITDARINRPYSYTNQTLNVDANYRLSRGIKLKSGVEYKKIDRNFSEVDKTDEETWSTGIVFNRWSSVNLSVNLLQAERDSDKYIGNKPYIDTHAPGTIDAADFENHPLLRKYYLTDRQRQQAQIRIDWFAANAMSVGLGAAHNNDKYDDDYFGLNNAKVFTVSLDSTYQINEDLQLTAFVAQDSYDTEQAGRSFTAAPGQYLDPNRNWNVVSNDTFKSAAINLDRKGIKVPGQWHNFLAATTMDTGLEISYSRSESDFNTNTGTGLSVTPLPNVSTRLTSYRWYLRLITPSRAHINFALQHENYQSKDFAFDYLGPASIANVLTLGEESPNYSLNWITMSYSLPF